MTSVETLRPTGAAVGWGSGSGGAFGASPQWADDDDSTGASRTVGSTQGGVAAALPTLAGDPAKVVGITAWVRMSCTSSAAQVSLGTDETAFGPAYIINLSQDASLYYFPTTFGGTLHTYDLPYLHAGVFDGRGVAFVADALAAGGVWISIQPSAASATITVVDVAVLVEYADATVVIAGNLDTTPVTRLWPRDDARGISSTARIWPPPKANRIVGGYP